jgi:hypothetical protein
MEIFKVDYEVSFKEVRMGVFEAMDDSRHADSDSGYRLGTTMWLFPGPRVLAAEPTVGVDSESLQPTALAKYNRRVGMEIYFRVGRFRVRKHLGISRTRAIVDFERLSLSGHVVL